MFDDEFDIFDDNVVTVHTTNKRLLNIIKELEFNGTLVSRDYEVGMFDFVCESIKIDKDDKYQVYVQFIDDKYDNRIEGYDSYIYSNDYETAVLDLLNAMYNSGFVSLCSLDVRSCLRNKSFNHYKYTINEPLTPKLLQKILNGLNIHNKECILICHGINDVADIEFSILWEALKNTKNILWWPAYITNGIKSNDRWLSLYIEK